MQVPSGASATEEKQQDTIPTLKRKRLEAKITIYDPEEESLTWLHETSFPPDSLVDIVLIVEDHGFKVHKAILASMSNFFEAAFSKDLNVRVLALKTPSLAIVMKQFLQVLYSMVDLSQDIAFSILEVAHYYDVPKLERNCCDVLKTLTADDVRLPSIYQLVCQCNIRPLMDDLLDPMTQWLINKVDTPNEWDVLSPHTQSRLVQNLIKDPTFFHSTAQQLENFKPSDTICRGELLDARDPAERNGPRKNSTFAAIALEDYRAGSATCVVRFLFGKVAVVNVADCFGRN